MQAPLQVSPTPAKIHYRITPANPAAHLFEIEMKIDQPNPQGQRISLPVWIAGSYLVREFAKNIVQITAHDRNGPVALEKLDKCSWLAAPTDGPLTLSYTVYGYDLSVRTAYLDQSRAFFNGSSVFLAVDGQQEQPVNVELVCPSGEQYRSWRVATSLPELGAERYDFGTYTAANYDELIDHPVELGNFTLLQFEACGVPHDFVLAGRLPKLDTERLIRDTQAICEYQIKLFGEPAPFARYVFMTMVLGDGYGGLEHRASTALMCDRDSLPCPHETTMKSGYRQYLGLISHEYFHNWNVKRIKPAAYAPYPTASEAYTRLLWAFEGLTSYYDDLCLVRSGRIDVSSYLELLSQTMTTVLRAPGVNVQSVSDSSFDTWIKHYRADENSPNATISYYTKGALVGLCLDLHIRQHTQGAKSLDDVMLALWQRYGRDFYHGKPIGVAEGEWEAIACEVSGLDLMPMFDRWLRTTEPLPLAQMLATVAIEWQQRPQVGSSDKGGWLEKTSSPAVWLGTRNGSDGGLVKLSHVLSAGPAMQAGLSAGDVLVAINGLKASPANLEAALVQAGPGDIMDVLAFRRDELINAQLILQTPPCNTIGLKVCTADSAQLTAQKYWLAI